MTVCPKLLGNSADENICREETWTDRKRKLGNIA
jgi:hypothetical protein